MNDSNLEQSYLKLFCILKDEIFDIFKSAKNYSIDLNIGHYKILTCLNS